MLEQKEFEDRRAAQIKALETMIEKPGIKVIELVEILLEQNPGLPVVLQDGCWQFPIVSVRADPENGVRLYLSPPAESTPADGREQADRRSDGIGEMETGENENQEQNESTP